MRFADLWDWHGTIDRGPYLIWGAILFAIKYNLDRVVAGAFFHRSWQPLNYIVPSGHGTTLPTLGPGDVSFFATMAAMSLPFIWSGTVLTMRRLHGLAMPGWMLLLFFIPVVNLFFFCVLAILPSRVAGSGPYVPTFTSLDAPRSGLLERIIPRSTLGSAFMAVVLVVPPAVATVAAGSSWLGNYGWGLFVGIPFAVGLVSVLIYSYHGPRRFGECMMVSSLAITLVAAGLIVVAVEGLICLMMAAPLALTLAVMGGAVGWFIQRQYWKHAEILTLALVLMLLAPCVVGWEWASDPRPPLLEVASTIDVDAPPAAVWRNVVAFSQLPEPTERIFQTGIAYPVRAVIRGHGVGATRYCMFTTGAFVEPIRVWDEPRVLGFGVISQPAPMREMTPYSGLYPPHLDNYLVSERGQFDLEPLPGGRTRLTGTTWYRHKVWPVAYWRLYSDGIIHQIHMRVLRHVKRLSERT